MDDGGMTSESLRPEKQKREKISRGRRKHRHEKDLRGDKCEHSPTESRKHHGGGCSEYGVGERMVYSV